MVEIPSGGEYNGCKYGIDGIDSTNYEDSINILGWMFVKKSKRVGKIKVLLVDENGKQYIFDTDVNKRYDLKYLYMSNNLVDAGFSLFVSKDFHEGIYHMYIIMDDYIVNTPYDINI